MNQLLINLYKSPEIMLRRPILNGHILYDTLYIPFFKSDKILEIETRIVLTGVKDVVGAGGKWMSQQKSNMSNLVAWKFFVSSLCHCQYPSCNIVL